MGNLHNLHITSIYSIKPHVPHGEWNEYQDTVYFLFSQIKQICEYKCRIFPEKLALAYLTYLQ